MPDNPMQRMLADPGFDKLAEPQKYDQVIAGLERSEPSFVHADPKTKMREATAILTRAGKLHPSPIRGGGAALQKPLPAGVEAAESFIAPAIAGTAGAAAGTAAGGPLGAAAGAGAGIAAADVASAYVNKRFFGRNPDLSLRHVASEEALNATLGALTEAIPTGSILRGVIGATPLIEGAKGAQSEATAAAERFAEQRAASSAKAGTAVAEARAATAKQLAPAARGQAIEQGLGRTAEQGAAARSAPAAMAHGAALPSDPVIERQTQWADAVFNPIHRAAKELGNQYERLFNGVRKETLRDTTSLQYSLDRIAAQEKEGIGSPVAPGAGVQKLFKLLRSIVTPSPKKEIQAEFSPEALAALPADQREYFAAMQEDISKELLSDADPNVAVKPTVNRLLQARAAATALTRSSAASRDKAAAFQAIEAIDGQLENSGLVDMGRLQSINRRYGSYRRTFDQSYRRTMAGEFEPTDAAGELFTSPQRFEQTWSGANPEERATLRQTYGDWVLKNGVERAPGILRQQDQKAVLAKLYPNTPLADPNNWVHLDDHLVTAENVINTSPEMRQQFQGQMQARLKEISDQSAKEAVTWAQKEAKNLGPYGEAMAKQARQAKTPQEGAKVVMDFMRRHPEDAPIQALMSGVTEGKPGAFVSRAKRGLAWYPEILAATWMMGHPSTFAAAGLGAAGVAGIHVGLQRGLKWALKNPETAQLFWKAVNNSDSFARTRALGRMTSDALMAEVAAGFSRKTGIAVAQQDQAQP